MAVVLITGCSSGFGLATALAFAQRGDNVYATMRDLQRSGDLAEAARAAKLPIEVLTLDVTDDTSVRTAVGRVLDAEGRIDVLVNNAGVSHMGAVEVLGIDQARAVFETNLFGAVRMLQAVLPTMRKRHSGVVVNVSSVAGRLPGTPANWAYSSSKHALSSLSDSLAEEVRPFGIRVVCIEPGFFKTSVARKAGRNPGGSPYGELEAAVGRYYYESVQAGGDPRVVAETIVAAASDESSPIHVPIGTDAGIVIQAAAGMSERQWASAARAAFGLER